jgi:HK97 gp10 family phage protein
MEQSGVKVKGLRSVTKALQNIGVPNKEITDAAKRSADRVVNEAKTLAPVRSGALRDSIRIAARATGRVGISAGNNGRVPYANPIHWGWFKRNIKPQPFFIKAIGLTRNDVYQDYLQELEGLILRESKKAQGQND